MWKTCILRCLACIAVLIKSNIATRHFSNELCAGPVYEYSNIEQVDYVIGGMFPVHYPSDGIYKYNRPGLMWIQAMLFAIEEINNSTELLPNTTLGYRIFDTCNTIHRALQQTLLLTEGVVDSVNRTGNECPCVRNVYNSMVALVGDAASATTTKIASLLTATSTAQISYSATSTVLNNKYIYKSFMRTIPPDNFQAILITDFIEQFKWNYVNIIACDDDYGRIGVDELVPRLKQQGICLAVYEVYDVKNDANGELTSHVMNKLKAELEAMVVVLWCQRPEALKVLQAAEAMHVYHRTWIATETYGNSASLFKYSPNIINGLFGIIPVQTTYQPFMENLKSITPNSTHTQNPWLHDYWLDFKHCRPITTAGGDPTNVKYVCPGDVTDLTELPANKYVNVIDSVYAIAHGLHSYLKEHGGGKTYIPPAELFPYVKNVSFTGKSNVMISFNEQGNPEEAMYSITNLHANATQKEFVVVGSWNKKSRKITLNNNMIQFANFSKTTPRSSCAEQCKPGFMGVAYGDKPCCWKCVACSEGEVKPREGPDACVTCPGDSMPNKERTKCLYPTLTYLEASSKSGAVIISFMVLGYILILASIFVFVKHRNTPIVKASNRGLSILQIVSMLFQLALPILYMQKENREEMCDLRLFYYQIFYTISISVTFTKADRLLRVFEASKSGILIKHSAMKGNSVQYVTVLLLTAVGLALCTIMVVIFKPGIAKQISYSEQDEINMLIYCGGHYDTILFSMVGYIVLISLVCSVYAFKARKLPHDFNEARYTSFAMFTFLLTWTMAVPIYFSQRDEISKSASWCLLCFVSTIVIFIPMYLPKCYIILFEAEKNTEAHFRENLKRKNVSDNEMSSSVHFSYAGSQQNNNKTATGDTVKQN